MIDNHSAHEWIYKPRWIADRLRAAVADTSVLVVTGPRQTGKTSLLQHESPFRNWTFHTLDDFDTLDQAERDPASLWAQSDRVIIDEVQKSTRLLPAIKLAVDKNRSRVKFALSGSFNLGLLQKVTETLAGRALTFSLLPMTLGELRGRKAPAILSQLLGSHKPVIRASLHAEDPIPLLIRGLMPPLIQLRQTDSCVQWWEGYVSTYLERDLRQVSRIESLPDFRRTMQTLALRNGQTMNQTEISRDAGLSQPTIHRYINVLEVSCLLEKVPAYFRNRTKRLIKTPRLFWVDPGLAAYLSGIHEENQLREAKECGFLFETLAYLHLRVLSELLLPRARLYYWRTTDGKEVDFVLEQGTKLIAIEVKLSEKVHYSDTESLRLFLSEYPETTAALIIHTGKEMSQLGDKIFAAPWWLLS